MCGLWSLRPSAGRISFKDMSDSLLGQEAVKIVGGPMGHSARDINLFLSSYMAYKPWEHDPNVLVMPWDEKLVASWQERPLTFAIAWGDEQVSLILLS
jgi:amidase